jgi:hypothetical protein
VCLTWRKRVRKIRGKCIRWKGLLELVQQQLVLEVGTAVVEEKGEG